MVRFRLACIVSCLVFCFTALTYVATHAVAQGGTSTERVDANKFEGKYLAIQTNRELSKDGIFLCKVRVETVGNHTFLVGTGYAIEADIDPKEGSTGWVSVDKIESMAVFDSREQMVKYYETTDEK